MAETKPMTTGGLLGDEKKDDLKKNESLTGKAAADAADKSAATKAAAAPRKAGTTAAEGSANADELETKPGDPSPTQAELDSMREKQFGGQRRDMKAEGDAAEYKKR